MGSFVRLYVADHVRLLSQISDFVTSWEAGWSLQASRDSLSALFGCMAVCGDVRVSGMLCEDSSANTLLLDHADWARVIAEVGYRPPQK